MSRFWEDKWRLVSAMKEFGECRVAASVGLSLLFTILSVLVWSRCCGHLGFSAPDTWYQWLTLASNLSSSCITAAFLAGAVAAYLLLGEKRTLKIASQLLGIAGTGVVFSVFVIRLLTSHWIDKLSALAVGDSLGSEFATLATDGFVDGIFPWLLFVGMCSAAWRIGHAAGSGGGLHSARVWSLVVAWVLARFLQATVQYAPYSTHLGLSLFGVTIFWSCWSSIAGVFCGWGGVWNGRTVATRTPDDVGN